MEEVKGQLQVEEGPPVAPPHQLAAELAEQQGVRGDARRRGDVGGHAAAVADPEVDVVAEVGTEVTAVGQDVQGDAGEGEGGGDILWCYIITLKVTYYKQRLLESTG